MAAKPVRIQESDDARYFKLIIYPQIHIMINDDFLYDLGINSRHPCSSNIGTWYSCPTGLSDAQLIELAPAIFGEKAHESRSEKYKYIPTYNLLAELKLHGYTIHGVNQAKVRGNGDNNYAKHAVLIRHTEKEKSQFGAPELFIVNAHDGTSSWRVISSWRMKGGASFLSADSEERIQHRGKNVIEKVISSAEKTLLKAHQMEIELQLMSNRILTSAELDLFIKRALVVRYHDPASNKEVNFNDYPVNIQSVKELFKKPPSVLECISSVSDALINGKIIGVDPSGEERKQRAITNIGKRVATKQALYLFATSIIYPEEG